MNRSITILLLAIILAGCSDTSPSQTSLGTDVPTPGTTSTHTATTRPAATRPSADLGDDLRARIATAHGISTWRNKQVLAAEISVEYMSKQQVSGTLFYECNTDRVRMELDGGVTMVYDGAQAWASPASRGTKGQVRFHLRAWPYLMAAPFKFLDPGVNYEDREKRYMLWQECESGMITFDEGVGDTPNDWFHIYAQPDTDRLLGFGYIVSYNTPLEKAEKTPHAMIFETFEEVDGVVIPSFWRIHRWHDGRPAGDRLGNVSLENIRFIDSAPGMFTAPPNSMSDPNPVVPATPAAG